MKLYQNKFFNLKSAKCNNFLTDYILRKYYNKENFEKLENIVKNVVKFFVSKCILKWKASHRIYERFVEKNDKWLQAEFQLPGTERRSFDTDKKKGRPKKIFEVCSKRTKSRNVMALVSEKSPEELCLAAQKSLIKSGKRSAAAVVKLAVHSTSEQLKEIKMVHDSPSTSILPYKPEEALALIIDCDLGKEKYTDIQKGAKRRGANIYPPYNVISEVKKQCYPKNVIITDTEARIPLQDLLDLTIQRLVQVQLEVLQRMPSDITTVDVMYKWGLDGSGGHSIYKQNLSSSQYGDSNIILSTIVPLEMSAKTNNSKQIYWKNTKSSSPRYCRPIGFQLLKETSVNMKKEYDLVESQISKLKPTIVTVSAKDLHFKHIIMCTMLDGKTCNVLTDTASTQTCNVCKITPKDINNLPKVFSRKCDKDTYKFGISVLHCYLRFYELLLHVAYKLDLKQWQARTPEAKLSVKNRKTLIAETFYKEMGLVVDQPKQGGGNSNDGNTARKFFENPEKVAGITGLNSDLLKKFSNILSVLASGHYIKTEYFKSYCLEAAELYINLYPWYNMSATVHKILIHGADIIESLLLPVGQLSEDVLEASHKAYKTIRLHHSRKTARVHTNTDILHMLLISSDPVISSYRKATRNRKNVYPQEVLNMLKIPDFLEDMGQFASEDINDSDVDSE